MSEQQQELEQALTDLTYAGILEGLDQGDYWGDLTDMFRNWEELASPEFAEAMRRELISQHHRLKTEWEVVDFLEVRSYTTSDGEEHEETSGGNMLLPLALMTKNQP